MFPLILTVPSRDKSSPYYQTVSIRGDISGFKGLRAYSLVRSSLGKAGRRLDAFLNTQGLWRGFEMSSKQLSGVSGWASGSGWFGLMCGHCRMLIGAFGTGSRIVNRLRARILLTCELCAEATSGWPSMAALWNVWLPARSIKSHCCCRCFF